MRREFALPREDLEWLEACGRKFELVKENQVLRVVLDQYPVPAGYNQASVKANVRIDPGYPDSQIDMVYFYPALALLDGRPIGGLCNDQFDNLNWQRWSRHRTQANPWRPGIDNLATHFELVNEWLARELRKRA